MRWKRDPETSLGEMRTECRFAWFPVTVVGDIVVWLECYSVDQQYQEVTKNDGSWSWVERAWVDVSTYLEEQ
jgi:hypothetical protein